MIAICEKGAYSDTSVAIFRFYGTKDSFELWLEKENSRTQSIYNAKRYTGATNYDELVLVAFILSDSMPDVEMSWASFTDLGELK